MFWSDSFALVVATAVPYRTARADCCWPYAGNILQQIVDDPMEGLHLKLQLAVLCDVGRVITKATYALESDAPMIEKVK